MLGEMKVTDIAQIAQLPEGVLRAKIEYWNGQVENRRISRNKEGSAFAVFAKNSRTRGYWHHEFRNIVSLDVSLKPPAQTDIAEQWRKSWVKALGMATVSGLWPELQKDIRLGLEIGYDTIQKAYDAYWVDSTNDTVVRVGAIEPRLIGITLEGQSYVDTSILWTMSTPAKIKKMYFGKHSSDYYLRMIEEAMRKEKALSFRTRARYDVSFEYKPDCCKAWYSEEYRGCCNGHYYLALNATHALFYEDD